MIALYEELEIIGFDNRRIPNTLHLLEKERTDTALVFPGYGYTSKMPLLFYLVEVLYNKGYNVLTVDINYSKKSEFMTLTREERMNWYHDDVMSVFNAVQSEGYDVRVLVGKSLGTTGINYILHSIQNPELSHLIWLTPLLRDDAIMKTIQITDTKSLVVIGSSDPHYDDAKLRTLSSKKHVECIVIPDADHGMNISGDIARSLQALTEIIEKSQSFLE